jgi:small subunit ribosomal protein S29
MASSSLNCWKCLSRPSLPATFPSPSSLIRPAACFSTTSRNLAGPPPPKKDLKAKGMKFTLKKKEPPKQTGKAPAQGERKAMRKRIVLSNTNALEVSSLRDLDAEMVDDMVRVRDEAEEFALQGAMAGREGEEMVVRQEVVGRVVGLKGETVDSLRAVEAFKTTQGWGLFRRPALLVREESVGLSRQLLRAQETKQALRLVIDGEKGAGKSLMLIHAMATAFVKGWVVVNIPEGKLYSISCKMKEADKMV